MSIMAYTWVRNAGVKRWHLEDRRTGHTVCGALLKDRRAIVGTTPDVRALCPDCRRAALADR